MTETDVTPKANVSKDRRAYDYGDYALLKRMSKTETNPEIASLVKSIKVDPNLIWVLCASALFFAIIVSIFVVK